LAEEHIYFEFLCLDWLWRLEEAMRKEFKGMYELLPRKHLRHIPSDFYAWSAQAKQKKVECENGTMSLEEFRNWLQNS